jgi:hypothetical protein
MDHQWQWNVHIFPSLGIFTRFFARPSPLTPRQLAPPSARGRSLEYIPPLSNQRLFTRGPEGGVHIIT